MKGPNALVISILVSGCALPSRTEPSASARDLKAEDLFVLAERSERLGDSVRAEQYALAALSRGIPEERAVPLLVRVCIASDRPRSAIFHAEAYLADHPEDVTLRYLVAAIRYGLGDLAEARAALKELLASRPDFAPAQYLFGVALREAGDVDGARRAFLAHLRLDPHGPHSGEARTFLESLIDATRVSPAPKRSAGGPVGTGRSSPTNVAHGI